MGKKHMYVTDIYKMHRSFQALGIKRPQNLNLSNMKKVRNLFKRKEKSSFKKKRKNPASFTSTWLTFTQGLDFSRDFHPGQSLAAALPGSAVCVQ